MLSSTSVDTYINLLAPRLRGDSEWDLSLVVRIPESLRQSRGTADKVLRAFDSLANDHGGQTSLLISSCSKYLRALTRRLCNHSAYPALQFSFPLAVLAIPEFSHAHFEETLFKASRLALRRPHIFRQGSTVCAIQSVRVSRTHP